MSVAATPTVAVVGIHGYGASHVVRARELEAEGQLQLVGVVDPDASPVRRDGITLALGDLPPLYPSLPEMLAQRSADVVVIATPLHTHLALTQAALAAGADVVLEKPPVTSVADYRALQQSAVASGGLVQVGFQSLGSHAVTALQSAIARGELGELRSISAVGSWTRSVGYWTRSRWAGRRTIDGLRVADGAVSNPFAHALMTALRLAGWDAETDVGSIETDLRRVNPIEADDTSTVRVRASPTARGFAGDITCAFTLAGPREDDPMVTVVGDRGTATLWYTRDELQIGAGPRQRFGRDGVLENLLAARAGRAELFSSLARTGAFCAVIDAVAQAPVAAIPAGHVQWVGDGDDAHPLLVDADRIVARAARTGRLFRELAGGVWAS